jgi:ABC-type glycerol-3-phosphate transport system substrate-binding protein
MRRRVAAAVVLCIALGLSGGSVWAASSVSLWTQSATNPALLEVIQSFTQETGVEVEIKAVNWTTDAIFVAVAGGAPPDTFTHGSAALGAFVGANVLLPLDQIVDKWSFMKDMIPEVRGWNTADGRLYAIPWNGVQQRDFVYREDLWEESGVDPAQPPVTWEDLVRVGKKLVRFNAEGAMTRSALSLPKSSYGPQQAMLAWQVQAGGAMLQDGKPVMNDEPTREALQFYVDLFYEHRLEDFTFSGNFVTGTTTAAWNSITLMSQAEAQGARTRVATFPYRKRPASFSAVDWIGIARDTKNLDRAIQLVEYIVKPETQYILNEAIGGTIPAYRQAGRWEWVRRNPAIGHFINALSYGVPNPAHPLWFEMRSVLLTNFDRAIRRQATVNAVLEDLQRQMELVLEQ